MSTYFMLLTAAGARKMAAHLAGGGAPPLQIVSLALGAGATLVVEGHLLEIAA